MARSERADFVIIGGGIAGLRAALELPPEARTLMLAKDGRRQSATEYAQGGIAAALGPDDTVELHRRDTMAAGGGLCSEPAVELLVEEGPAAVEQLIAWGTAFDREPDGELARTREGAHSRARVLHAQGDSTGREIAAALARRAQSCPGLRWRAHCQATRLLAHDGVIGGVEYWDQERGEPVRVESGAVLLATGGLGQLYPDTTNPEVSTGDGVALAFEAGAVVADMEFVQFHPTALALAGAPPFLLSEALRGEGAVLRNAQGEAFMPLYHAAADLAPRDIVARALVREAERGPCYLDATSIPPLELKRHFPRIGGVLAGFGLHLDHDWIPVRPAAHYAMGGVRASLDGQTSLAGLWAAGECACTGVHGANRLASNSLLEGLVFGRRSGQSMAAAAALGRGGLLAAPARNEGQAARPRDTELDRVRHILGSCVGVLRSGDALRRAEAQLLQLLVQAPRSLSATTALLITRAALAREESRGAHFRTDFPAASAALAQQHSLQSLGTAVSFGAIAD